MLIPILILIGLVIVTELGRPPFDLLEGERELVRGFNVEVGERTFAVLFIGEYGILIYIRALNNLILRAHLLVFILLIFLLRASFPRIRYDVLLSLY